MFKCIIVDDEPHAIEGLKNYIKQIPYLDLIKIYTNPITALNELLIKENIDLIFLDIDMPEISGIELAKEIRNKATKIIFTTGFTKYAYDAFDVLADGYLLKPYSLSKFITVIDKVMGEKNSQLDKETVEDFFFVKSTRDNLRLIKVDYSEIIAVESDRNYIIIHTTEKKIHSYMSLTQISGVLSRHYGFIKFQRSYIISLNYIEHIEGNSIYMKNGLKITVGEYYRKSFSDFVSSKLIDSLIKVKK